MATVLDIGLLEGFSSLFAMLLVVALVYGILEYAKLFGEKRGLHAFIALIIGIMVLLFPNVTEVLTTITPWFALLFIFLLFMLMFYRIFGVKNEDLSRVLKNNPSIIYWIIIISIIVLASGIGTVFFAGEEELVPEVTTEGTIVPGEVGGTGTGAFFATLFHEKILGLIFVLLIGVFTISLLTGVPKIKKE